MTEEETKKIISSEVASLLQQHRVLRIINDDEELSRETKAGHLQAYKPRENGKALYFKRDIARLAGFKL